MGRTIQDGQFHEQAENQGEDTLASQEEPSLDPQRTQRFERPASHEDISAESASVNNISADEDDAPAIDEELTQHLDPEALEKERQFAERRVKEETAALDSLYEYNEEEDEEDEGLTTILEPIGPATRTVMPVSAGPTDTVQHTIEQGESRIRHKVAAALISILVIFGIGLGAGMYKHHLESQADTAARIAENERLAEEARIAQEQADAEAEEARIAEVARAPRALKFIVSAQDYDLLSSRIPLSITGIDLEGNEVKTTGFINAEGEGLSLAPGEYTATIPASPIRSDGNIYQVPSDTFSLRVPNNDQEQIQIDQAIVLIPLSSGAITEELLNNTYEWGMKDSQFASVVEANVGVARKALEEEKARKQAEERKRLAEEQRAPLAQQFVERFYTNVSFPDKDDDSKVLVVTNWSAVVSQYVASGSSASSKIGNGNGASYSYATYVNVIDVSDNAVTVEVKYVSGSEIKNGWTRNASEKRVVCTFNDNNKITDFSIS